MVDKKDSKIIVAQDYDCMLNTDEIEEIIKDYIDLDKVQDHNIDEGKTYFNLKNMDDETWSSFIGEWNNQSTKSGYIIIKYEDWRMCSLPVGWS
ncbi:unnamed protein product [Cunninghamella blakesleeana]